MQRTNFIDYGIVIKSEVKLDPEDGCKTTGHGGCAIIPRGTNDLWRNTATGPGRIAFVLIEAPAYRHNGSPLVEFKPEQAIADHRQS